MNQRAQRVRDSSADSGAARDAARAMRRGGTSNQAMLAASRDGQHSFDPGGGHGAAQVREAATLAALARQAGGGEPLPASLRRPAEQAMELDLGQVRLHRGEGAGAVTRAAGARAAQWRNHVFIRPDRFAPDTGEGRSLIGHELLHAGQRINRSAGSTTLSRHDHAGEREAARLGASVLTGRPGAARPREAASAQVSLDEEDAPQVASLPPQVCSLDSPPDSGEDDSDDPQSDPQTYTLDPSQVDVTQMNNGQLIDQGIENRRVIATFRRSDAETAAWNQLDRETEDERARRIQQGFVFLGAARSSRPQQIFELRGGMIRGTTGIYIGSPEVAFGSPDITPGGLMMTMEQLTAYMRSSGFVEARGEQAQQILAILQSGDADALARRYAPGGQLGEDDEMLPMGMGGYSAISDPVAGTQLVPSPFPNPFTAPIIRAPRSTAAVDLVTSGAARWQLPIDAYGVRAVGMMGEASYWTGPQARSGAGGLDLNAPNISWTNMLGQTQSGNTPIADFIQFGPSSIDGPYAGIPVSNAATSQADQARALRFLLNKFAIMLDVPGRAGEVAPAGPPTIDAAVEHVRRAAGDPTLMPGTHEFADAQRRFLSDTMFSVPPERLATIRDAVGRPFETREGGTRPAMLEGYRALYDRVLITAPIEVTLRDGSVVPVHDFATLVGYLPNGLRTEADQVPGGPPRDATIGPTERERVFDLLGRMAQSRIISADVQNELLGSADMLRGVDTPGSTDPQTRVLDMNIGDFAATGLRIREGLYDPRSSDGPGSFRWRTAESQRQADAYLSFMRMLTQKPDLQRSDPEFVRLRAEVSREIILSVPADMQAPLLDAIQNSDSQLATDVRSALSADAAQQPTLESPIDRLARQVSGFDMTSGQLDATRQYATDLHAQYGESAPLHLSPDALTLRQQPGFEGMMRRGWGSAGHTLGMNALGYGTTALLDWASGREVHGPGVGQVGIDFGVGLASQEIERQMAARLFSRVPISSALGRTVFQRAAPGFILQPAINTAFEYYSQDQDRDAYRQMGITMTEQESDQRYAHSVGVGLAGAAAGTATIWYFTAAGAGGGAAAGGVGAAPGALVGFLAGAAVVGVSWVADKLLPGGAEDWHERHAREMQERERRRQEMIARWELPVGSVDLSRLRLPVRLSPDLSMQEQMVIASWMMMNAQ